MKVHLELRLGQILMMVMVEAVAVVLMVDLQQAVADILMQGQKVMAGIMAAVAAEEPLSVVIRQTVAQEEKVRLG